MKVFIAFTFLIICSCNHKASKEKIANIYIAGCDSIFYCSNEKFDPVMLNGSKKDDSVFINGVVKDILNQSKKVFVKPLGGSCGGVGETLINFSGLFKGKGIIYSFAHTDSAEEKYFNDVSFLDKLKELTDFKMMRIADEHPTMANKSVLFLSLDKKNKISYRYSDSTNDSKFSGVIPATENQITQLIADLKMKNNINAENIRVVFHAQGNEPVSGIIKINKALRKEGIQKISLTTTE